MEYLNLTTENGRNGNIIEEMDISNSIQPINDFLARHNHEKIFLLGRTYDSNDNPVLRKLCQKNPNKFFYWALLNDIQKDPDNNSAINFSKKMIRYADRQVTNSRVIDDSRYSDAMPYILRSLYHNRYGSPHALGFCVEDDYSLYKDTDGYSSSTLELLITADLINRGYTFPPIAIIKGLYR